MTFRVTSNELKNAPLQKTGVLKGQTLTVDLRKANPIFDLSGYLDGRLRTVGEKAAVGGDVTIGSTGSVVQRSGASIDVSGGGYVYQGGRISTSQLLGEDGKNYDISTASKERVYSTVLDKFTRDFDRWGQSEVYNNLNVAQSVSEPGYLEGQRGGKLQFTAPRGLVLDGQLRGGATAGPTQLISQPRGGALSIGTNLNFLDTTIPVSSVTFTNRATTSLRAGFDVDSALSDDLREQLTLSTDTLFPSKSPRADAFYDPGRFDSIEINSTGLISLPAGVALRPGVETTLTLRGQEIDIAGSIVAPSGTVALQTRTLVNTTPTSQPERITLQPGAQISTSGLWLNNAGADGSTVGPLLPSGTAVAGSSTATSALNGGTISLFGGSADLQPGSVLDVSGGGRIARNNAVTAGNAGTISISADAGLGVPASNRFGADLRGYALGTGGSLTIALGQVQIGGGVGTGRRLPLRHEPVRAGWLSQLRPEWRAGSARGRGHPHRADRRVVAARPGGRHAAGLRRGSVQRRDPLRAARAPALEHQRGAAVQGNLDGRCLGGDRRLDHHPHRRLDHPRCDRWARRRRQPERPRWGHHAGPDRPFEPGSLHAARGRTRAVACRRALHREAERPGSAPGQPGRRRQRDLEHRACQGW